MHVQVFRLVRRKVVQHLKEPGAHLSQMGHSLGELEIPQIIGGDFVAQKGRVLLVLLDPGVFPIGPEHVLAVLDGFHDGLQFAIDPIAMSTAECSPDALPGHPP